MEHFTPRSRGGSDALYLTIASFLGHISTHAPAGGATHQKKKLRPLVCISTHAPAGGATNVMGFAWCFRDISTHAPARGATRPRESVTEKEETFQPTLPRGERPIPPSFSLYSLQFQPTLPRGERPKDGREYLENCWNFNPRSRGGSDSVEHTENGNIIKFQPTLPRGERQQK